MKSPGTSAKRLFVVAICLLPLACSSLTGVAAQGEPHGSSCSLPPVTLPLFDATPAADIAVATPPVSREAGTEATPEQIGTYTASLQLLVDCINTGDPAYVYAIFTREYLATWFVAPVNAYQPAFEQMIDQRVPADPGATPLSIASIDNVRLLDDSRLSGRVVLQSEMRWRDTLVLKQSGDDWLIDDVIRESR
jgi:hypothetical protein